MTESDRRPTGRWTSLPRWVKVFLISRAVIVILLIVALSAGHAGGALGLLLVATILSIYKPPGRTGFGSSAPNLARGSRA